MLLGEVSVLVLISLAADPAYPELRNGQPLRNVPKDCVPGSQFRKVIGYRDLAKLAVAIEHDLGRTTGSSPTQEAAILATA